METNNELTVKAEKDFSVRVEELYSAWTKPQLLKQWWKPIGNELADVVNDLKEGGTVKYVFSDNDIIISGTYKEVKENEKLVYSWNWQIPNDAVRNGEFMLTIEFKGSGNGSSIHVTQENFTNHEAMKPHQEGWEKGLNDLQQFLNNKSGGEASSNGQSSADAGTGYRELPEQQKVAGG
jgi:uncharacterized protein YndB with AHSA1/START domain